MDLKKSHPVQAAKFEVDHEHAFNWWVKHVLKKKDRIVASIRKQQASYLNKSHKFVMELPKTVEQALALDAKNGNTLWDDAISKELMNVKVTFKILPDGKKVPIGHQFMQCHKVLDIKMKDF